MSLVNIFYAFCDVFTLTEMQKAEAIRKIQNTPLCGDELFTYFHEEHYYSKSQTEEYKKNK